MALGVRTNQVMLLFLGKAALVGLVGGLLGVALGLWVAVNVGNTAGLTPTVRGLISSSTALRTTVAATPLVAVALAAVASWIAALFAVRQDPAVVLQGD